MSPNIAICCATRDCRPQYLLEWLCHHRALGIRRFYLYDNESAEPVSVTVSGLDFAEDIHVLPCTGYDANSQQEWYTDCCVRIRDGSLPSCDWLLVIDDDEFLRCDSLDAMVAACGEHPGLALSWRMIGTNGHEEYAPVPQVKRFPRGTGEDFPCNLHVKSLVDPRRVEKWAESHCARYVTGHAVDIRGRAVNGPFTPATHSVAWIDHYFTRSRQEYLAKMAARNSRGRYPMPLELSMMEEIDAATA
jgi:hypothetical protein